jgi:hypothetical protein
MKKILLNTILLLMVHYSFCQKDFAYCKGGLSLLIGGAKTSDDLTLLPALTIAPGFRIVKAKEFSITTDFPVSVGASNDDADFYFGIDAPATLNLNFGFGSSKRSTAKFGMSLGAGVGYHYSYNEFNDPYDDGEYDQLSVGGYVFQTGFFFRGKNSKKSLGGAGIRFSYMMNSNSAAVKKRIVGISLLATSL